MQRGAVAPASPEAAPAVAAAAEGGSVTAEAAIRAAAISALGKFVK